MIPLPPLLHRGGDPLTEPFDRLVQRRHVEALGVLVRRAVRHPRVAVAEHGQAGEAEGLGGVGDRLAVVAPADRHLGPEAAELAVQGLTASPDAQALATLSVREQQVLLLVVRGQTSAAIAEALNLSPKTVESYRSRLMAKLGVDDVTGLVRLAIREGLISADE